MIAHGLCETKVDGKRILSRICLYFLLLFSLLLRIIYTLQYNLWNLELWNVFHRVTKVSSHIVASSNTTKFNNSNYSCADMWADRISLHPVTESSIFFYILVNSHRSAARKSLQVSTMWNEHFLIKWLRLNVTVKVTLKTTTKTTRFQIICLIFFTRRCMRMCFENWHFQFYCLEFL